MKIEFLEKWEEIIPYMKSIVEETPFNFEELQITHNLCKGCNWSGFVNTLSHDSILKKKIVKLKNKRIFLRKYYSYSIPNYEAIYYIASITNNIIDIGSGKGYWIHLLKKFGLNTMAFDPIPITKNNYILGKTFFQETIKSFSDIKNILKMSHHQSLLLQWIPPSRESVDYFIEIINRYKGSNIFFSGLNKYCATKDFFIYLNNNYKIISSIILPRFIGIIDTLYHLKKR